MTKEIKINNEMEVKKKVLEWANDNLTMVRSDEYYKAMNNLKEFIKKL